MARPTAVIAPPMKSHSSITSSPGLGDYVVEFPEAYATLPASNHLDPAETWSGSHDRGYHAGPELNPSTVEAR